MYNDRYDVLSSKAEGGLTEDMAECIIRIGYFRHKDVHARSIVFDLEEGCFYEGDDTPHCMEMDAIDFLKEIPMLYHVPDWKPYYSDDEPAPSWHSFSWKLVFETKEGKYAYGGYTESLRSVPERFWEMDAFLRAILRGENIIMPENQ